MPLQTRGTLRGSARFREQKISLVGSLQCAWMLLSTSFLIKRTHLQSRAYLFCRLAEAPGCRRGSLARHLMCLPRPADAGPICCCYCCWAVDDDVHLRWFSSPPGAWQLTETVGIQAGRTLTSIACLFFEVCSPAPVLEGDVISRKRCNAPKAERNIHYLTLFPFFLFWLDIFGATVPL